MRVIPICFVAAFVTSVPAQDLPIGTRNISFYDSDRDRDIGTVIHYPGATTGTDVGHAEGAYPVLVFGHGFLMTVNAYENLRDHFVPRGYILVLPTTEGGIADHAAFGADLAFLATAMQNEGADAASPFHEHVSPATALMGHSMGGGASMLGASGNANIQAVVNLAAAETNPSAVAAAAAIEVPTLMFAGSEDCVTPIAGHQQPMYEALEVSCKAFVNIIGGGHCYFANSNFACDFGESTCFPALSVSRAQQQSVVNDIAGLWLDHFLKNDQVAYGSFLDSVSMSTRVIAETTCLTTSIAMAADHVYELMPVPANDILNITGLPISGQLTILDAQGRLVVTQRVNSIDLRIDVSDFPDGIYHLQISQGGRHTGRSFVVMH